MSLTCFFSGSSPPRFLDQAIDQCGARLLSCHDNYMSVARRWLRESHVHPLAKEREIMLDSGAFSAWSQGAEITLDEVMRAYDGFVSQYRDFYKHIWLINLDKIPGSKGVDPTADQITEALRISDQNFEALTKKFGKHVLPVYHQGEDIARLKVVMEQNNEYVCVSPRNDLHEKLRREWAQITHKHTEDIWTHGLATTGYGMMRTAPWHSVDSATWVQLAGWGKIILCIGGKLYIEPVSEDSPTLRNVTEHLDHLPAEAKDKIVGIVEECGFTWEQAKSDNAARSIINLNQMTKLVASIEHQNVAAQGGLF